MKTLEPISSQAAHTTSFKVVELHCANFRSYAVAEISPGPRLNCLIGTNGSGKTNILDALYYLALCRSPQNLKDSRSIRHGEEKFSLFGKFISPSETFTVSLGYAEGKAKEVQINGNILPKISEHIGRIPLIAAYPSDTYIIDDGGDLKRRFLNAAISQYDHQHLNHLLQHDRLLRQRNAHLKEGSCDENLLDVLDEQINACAEPIFKARMDFCTSLRPIFQEFYSQLVNSQETVDLDYRSQLQKGDPLQLIRNARNTDRQLQHTSIGIHRDNLDFSLNGFPIRAEGSQGQRRSFMIALRLAQLQLLAQKTKTTPILLLDDLFDRLDPTRVARLIDIVLNAPFGQIFISDTQADRIAESLDYETDSHCFFNVENGNIEPMNI